MFLEVVIIRYCHTVACGHETAHTTRAVVTCTGLAIAQLQTVSLVGGSDRAQKIMLAMSALTVINLLIFRVIRHIGIILVADGEHEVRQYREFEQTIIPVALVLLGLQILGFTTQCHLGTELVFTFCHKDVGFHYTTFTLNNGLVVELVHIHQVQLERLGELLLQLHVDVLVIYTAKAEELGVITVSTHRRVDSFNERFCRRLVDAADIAEVDLQFGAILATKSGATLEGVAKLTLECPFAVGVLCSIGIKGRA